MERPIRSGNSLTTNRARRGFTFVEVMVVATIIVIFITMAIPMYTRSLMRSRETVLASDLYTLRTLVQRYSYDKGRAPHGLEDLVSEGYLRKIPIDPMTDSANWKTKTEDANQAANPSEPGIGQVHSASDKTGQDGRPYSEW